MAAARVRRVFKYPDDDQPEDQAPDEGMDEQEQEKLIEELQRRDAETTSFWAFTLSSVIYLVAVMHLAFGVLFLSRASIASALSMCLSAFFVDRQRWRHPVLSKPPMLVPRLGLGRGTDLADEVLVVGNMLLVLMVFAGRAEGLGWQAPWPAFVMYTVSLAARWLLKPVNLAELVQLKYQYKGA